MPDKRPRFDLRTEDITFGRDDRSNEWKARIYRPEKKGPLPALVDVHGGAWSSGNHTTNAFLDKSLAQSGILVFAMGCRKAPDHPYPSQVQDVNFATRWLKSHAGEFQIDPRRMGGLGTSSGGHSLFLSAMRPGDHRYSVLPLDAGPPTDARLSYLIGAWPVLDPQARYVFAQEAENDFLVKRTDGYFPDRETMIEGNPQMALERGEDLDLPPILMIEGTADRNLPRDAGARFARAYQAAGGKARLETFEGMPHGFALNPGPESSRALDMMISFIISQRELP